MNDVIVVLDWDSKGKVKEFEKILPGKVLAWPESAFNPKLGKTFRGVERHQSDRIIAEANSVLNVISENPKTGIKMIDKDDYGKFKEEVFKVVENGIMLSDLRFSENFVREIMFLSSF